MGNINSWFATHVHVIWDMCTGIFSIERNCCHRSCLVRVMFSLCWNHHTFMDFNFTWNFLTCSVTGAVDGAGHAYHSGAPDVTSGPVFCGGSYCKCFSFCVVLFIHFYSLCSVVFVYPCLLSCSCVLSRFCLVFGFYRFLIYPFTLFIWYAVADTWTF